MRLTVVQVKIKDEKLAELEAAVKEMFAEITRARPEGVHYATCKLSDGVSFFVLLGLDGDNNPLMSVPKFTEIQARMKKMHAEPAKLEQLEVVGQYGMFE
jgi:hypothetical protein